MKRDSCVERHKSREAARQEAPGRGCATRAALRRATLACAAVAFLATTVLAVNIRQGIYTVTIPKSSANGVAQANFAGLAKRATVTASNLGTTCVVQLDAAGSQRALFTSAALSTGTTTLALDDLPVAEATEWRVTCGATMATTKTVTIQLCYDANE